MHCGIVLAQGNEPHIHPPFMEERRMNDDLKTCTWDEWNDIGGEG
jgi:hypothetical protein